LLFSALLISAIWAITREDIYGLFFNGGKYFFTVIITIVLSGILCGIATLSLLTKGFLPIIITISNGAVFGSLFLLIYLFTSYLMEKTSNWLCETFKKPAADNFYSTMVWVTLLLIISAILPIGSSIANTASAVFIILIPGLIAGPTLKAIFLFLTKKRRA
jgi:glucose-6-phosphate-specific signal transduction histidine kinase